MEQRTRRYGERPKQRRQWLGLVTVCIWVRHRPGPAPEGSGADHVCRACGVLLWYVDGPGPDVPAVDVEEQQREWAVADAQRHRARLPDSGEWLEWGESKHVVEPVARLETPRDRLEARRAGAGRNHDDGADGAGTADEQWTAIEQ